MPAPKPVAETDGGTSSIPRHLWAPPMPEARRGETAPRLPRLVLLLPVLTLIAGYAAAAAARTHLTAAGWLLGLAMTALIAFAAAIGMRCCHVARYRREAPG